MPLVLKKGQEVTFLNDNGLLAATVFDKCGIFVGRLDIPTKDPKTPNKELGIWLNKELAKKGLFAVPTVDAPYAFHIK